MEKYEHMHEIKRICGLWGKMVDKVVLVGLISAMAGMEIKPVALAILQQLPKL